jgi:14-3-3 protein epsilon
MCAWTAHIAAMNVELTDEERNLFSVAHKNLIGSRRASWRILASLLHKQSSRQSALDRCNERYILLLESELTDICQNVLKLLETHLLTHSRDSQARVFYWKM